jgi:hypothetical protein
MTTSPRSLFSLKAQRISMVKAKDTKRAVYALLVVANGKLQVTRDNTLLLVVARSVASEFENLSGKVLENSREIDCQGTRTVSAP